MGAHTSKYVHLPLKRLGKDPNTNLYPFTYLYPDSPPPKNIYLCYRPWWPWWPSGLSRNDSNSSRDIHLGPGSNPA